MCSCSPMTSQVIGGLVLTKAIMNLIPYTNYTIKVAGVPGEGNTGIPSEPVYVTTNEERKSSAVHQYGMIISGEFQNLVLDLKSLPWQEYSSGDPRDDVKE